MPPQIHPTAYIHPAATVMGRATIGENSSVWPGAVVRADFDTVAIGRYTNIQENSTLHSQPMAPLRVGDYVSVGHNVVLHSCTIGDNVLVANHATVLDRAVVGKNSVVAAGALVTPGMKVPENSMVMGLPGKIIEGKGDMQGNLNNAMSYYELALAYKEGRAEQMVPQELFRRMGEHAKKGIRPKTI